MQALGFVVAVVVLVMVEGRTVSDNIDDINNDINNGTTGRPCPYLFVRNERGFCEAQEGYVREKFSSSLRSRQLPGTTCPYCAKGIYDLYPNWNDCSKFYFCLFEMIVELDCTELGGMYFNPTTKRCESVDQQSNSCRYKTFDLRTGSGA